MIVNPQLFNYRLITGSLIVAIVVLSIYSFTSYQSALSQQAFLEQETDLISNELSAMMFQYETISSDNDLITAQLEEARRSTQNALDSINILEGNIAVYSKFSNQLATVRTQNKSLFKTIDSLEVVASDLEKDNNQVRSALKENLAENKALKIENDELSTKVEIGSKFYADHLNVKAFTVTKGSRLETNKASDTQSLEVCFTVSENVLTESGEKELYIQIVNPKNNVVADKGAVTFGDASLIYSAKKVIYYDNEAHDLCINVKADRDDKPLIKGQYYVSIFHDERKLVSTKLNLE